MKTYKISDEKLQERMGFKPFNHQRDIIEAYNTHRDIRLAAGRRFGKSALCAYFAIKEFMKDNKHVWIVSPTYDLSEKVFEYIQRWLTTAYPGAQGYITTRVPAFIKAPCNPKEPWCSWIKCKSTDTPVGLIGEELDLVILDEAAEIKKGVWETQIYNNLATRRGKSVMISTPKGKNWFYREWLRAKNAEDGASFNFESRDNPYYPEGEWERTKKNIPIQIFKQQNQALFLDDAASVFRSPRSCATAELTEYNAKHLYIMGIDLGRKHDFTVLTIVDRMTNEVVAFDRFNQIDWEFQKKRIITLCEKYNKCPIWIDSTGASVGDAFVRELSDAGLSVDGYNFTNISKRQIIEKLGVMIDQKCIRFPDIEVLIDELESFGYEITPSGNIRYQAPEGLFDDCVISLALACLELDNEPLQEIKKGEEILNYDIQTY